MAGTTDVLAIPYPEGGDAFSATVIQNLAERVDEAPGIESLTTVQIEALTGDLKVEGRVVYNTTTNKLQISNGTSFADVDAAALASAALKLPLAGGTMTGGLVMSGATIAMGSQKITGLAAGTTAGDAVRYEQVLRLAGGTMSGNIDVGDNYLLNVKASGAAADGATVGQVNAAEGRSFPTACVKYGGGAVDEAGTTFTIGALPAGTSAWVVVAQALSGGYADYVKTSAPTATQFTAYTYDVSSGAVTGNIAWIAIAV